MPSGGARLLAGRRLKGVKAQRDHALELILLRDEERARRSAKAFSDMYKEATDRKLEMPLGFLLRVMRHSDDISIAMQAAMAAAPYCHPKLQAIMFKQETPGDNARDVTDITEYFAGRISDARSRVVRGTAETTAREIIDVEDAVEELVGAAGPDTAE